MEKKGIVFTCLNGDKEYYDPITEDEITENETHYILSMHYKYEIEKSNILSYEFYDLCENCKYSIDCCRCIYSLKKIEGL